MRRAQVGIDPFHLAGNQTGKLRVIIHSSNRICTACALFCGVSCSLGGWPCKATDHIGLDVIDDDGCALYEAERRLSGKGAKMKRDAQVAVPGQFAAGYICFAGTQDLPLHQQHHFIRAGLKGVNGVGGSLVHQFDTRPTC